MVVGNFKRKELILPIGLGILFSLLYIKLPLKYFAFALMGFISVVSILYDVRLGLIMGVFIMPYMPDMLNLLFMIFVILAYIYRETFRERNPLTKDSIDVPIVVFVLAIIISTITSLDPKGSFRDLAIHMISIGFMFVMINSIRNKKDFNIVITFLVFTGTLVALYGLFQFKVGVQMEAKWLDTANNSGITARVFSVFGNPNILAEYLIMIIPISVSLFWYTKKLSQKVIFFLTSMILLITLLLTYSRGGWLGFAFGMLVFVLLVQKKLLLLLIPLGLGSVYFLPQTILNRILSIGNLADSSNAYRIKIWRISIGIIKDYWVSGVGFGYIPFKKTFETYIRTMPAYHAHNTYIETAAEMGIPGLIILLLFIFILYRYAIKKLIRGEDRYIKVVGAGILSGLAAILTQGAVENVLYLPKIIITFWTLVSFVLVLMRISNESREIG